jgi:GDP-4-dehydro-6-deoxy-D-mannose reductase
MTTVLVTGAGGFLGRYLCHFLPKESHLVGAALEDVEPVSGVEWKIVEEGGGLAHLVREMCPELVVHAAFVNRKPPDLNPKQYLDGILAVNLPLFETLADINGKVLLISSSAVYGKSEGNGQIDETFPFRPISLYGLAKVFQETAAQYYGSRGLRISVARLFNLSGPGQREGMVLPDWVSQAWAVAKGKDLELQIKHRKGSRDFVDVRDAARAITLMARDFKSGEVFNVASGESVSLEEISEELRRLCPVPLNILEMEPNPSDRDVFAQRGSFKKIQSTYGWHPTIDWRRSLKDLWEWYGRQR